MTLIIFIYETAKKNKTEEDKIESRTYISSLDLKRIVLNEPLKFSWSEDACNTDSDGLTDLQEVDEDSVLIEWDSGNPKFMTTHDL